MTLALVLGALLGGALFLLGVAIVPPRPAIGAAVARWEKGRATQAIIQADDDINDLNARAGRWLVTQLANKGITFEGFRKDLAITDSTLEAHLVKKFTAGLAGLLLPSILTVILMVLGIEPGFTFPALGGLVLGAVMFWAPDVDVKRDATRRRTELRRALACYLDLVSMSLSGGRATPEALPSCARIGRGWAFELIQATIDKARRTGTSDWEALEALGTRVGMPELEVLGSSLMLVSSDSAKVKGSLAARAVSQRQQQLAEAKGSAEKADQTIQIAQVILAAGFFLFLGYPAVVAVMGS